MATARAERFANEPNSLLEKLCLYQRGLCRSWPALVSSSLSSLHCPSLFFSRDFFFSFFSKIQSERILEANIHSFVWRLVKEKKDDGCVFVCANKYAYSYWPSVDSWCRVNVIMTSGDAICLLGSRVIQPLWGVKRSTAKQHQQIVNAFYIYSQPPWHGF